LRQDKGSILLITFWALSFLSFFALIMGVTARQKMALADRLNQRANLRVIASAGIEKAVSVLKRPDMDQETDSFKEPWTGGFENVNLGGAVFNVSIVDEERKININTASQQLLKDFFKAALDCPDSDAEVMSSSIVDWRDEDPFSLAQGAEDAYYEGLENPYECKDAKFDVLDELLLVRGITATIYQDIKDHVTLYGNGAVNVNTASRVVLLSLGLDEGLAEKIIAFRRGEDALEGTWDDRYFTGVGSMGAQLTEAGSLEQKESAQLSNLAASGSAGVTSWNFFIRSRAGYEYKKGFVAIGCVFQRIPKEAELGYDGRLRYWRIEHGVEGELRSRDYGAERKAGI